MRAHLFTYGTLQPGLAPPEIAAAVDLLEPVGEGLVRGLLYDLGDYPGAVLDPDSERKIFGTIFRLPEDEGVLRQLDAYEDFRPESPECSLFVRTECSAELADGGSLLCWIYVYNGTPELSRAVMSGRFQKKRVGL